MLLCPLHIQCVCVCVCVCTCVYRCVCACTIHFPPQNEGRQEGNVLFNDGHFIYGYIASTMVMDHSDSHMGYSF